MSREISELAQKRTWAIMDAPPDTNIVGSRWTYSLKRDASGAITHYNARLIAQGFTQTLRVDYNDTFVPVAKFTSTQVMLALTAINNWEVHQVDVKNAYLNTTLTEDIYMVQPPSFVESSTCGKVCKLLKALYGLKQGGRCWYLHICEVFAKFGYTRCMVEHCAFYKKMGEAIIIVVMAMDDLTLASNSPSLLLGCKSDL